MNGLDLGQVEQLRQVGGYLLKVREQQAISLEKVAQETFIPLRLLRAIETGEVQRLPEPVYIKGFIRRYADILGLDGVEVANAFEINPSPTVQPPTAQAPTVQAVERPNVADTPAPAVAPSGERSPRSGSYLPFVLAGIAALGAVGAIALGTSSLFKPNPMAKVTPSQASNPVKAIKSPAVSSNPRAAVVKPSSNPSIAPEPTATAASTPDSTAAAPTSVQVDIRLTDDSWMEVVVDGKVEYEGTMAKGEQRTWKAQKALLIRAGNAGAVVVSHNQSAAKPLGKLGDVVDVSFSR